MRLASFRLCSAIARKRQRALACALPLLAAVTTLAGTGCARPLVGPNPPTDRAIFPVGLAVHPGGRFLAVASSNYDLRYNRGALLFADLDRVDVALASVTDPNSANGEIQDAYVAGALIPSFANRPIFVANGSRALVATRDGNRVVEVPLDFRGDLPVIECAATEDDGTPACGDAPFVLEMPTNDPFEIVLTSESDTVWRGMISSLNDSEVYAFRLRDDREDSQRAQLLASDSVDFGETTLSVHGLALRTQGENVVIATRELAQEGTTQLRSELAWWPHGDGASATVRTADLTEDIGSLSTRAIALTPSQDALLVLMRNPPAIARYDITGQGAGTRMRLTAVAGTCDDPIRIIATTFEDGDGVVHERALLTCFSDDSLVSYDPVTLAELDSLLFFGRGPYDVVTQGSRAYVSYFLDDSVGVIDMVDDEGRLQLTARGRIGTPRPATGQ